MQIILSIVLTGIALTYCMEPILGFHKQTMQKIKRENWKKYIICQSRIFFVMGFLTMAGEIAGQTGAISPVQNLWITGGSCIVGVILVFISKRYFLLQLGQKAQQH